MIELKARKIRDNTRWEVCFREMGSLYWERCPGTTTYASNSNANIGLKRFRNRYLRDTIQQASHRLMASMPFGYKVIHE